MTQEELLAFAKQTFPNLTAPIEFRTASIGMSGCSGSGDAYPVQVLSRISLAHGDLEISDISAQFVLSHEVAHILFKHRASQFGPFTVIPKEEAHQHEFEADRFAVQTLLTQGHSSQDIIFAVTQYCDKLLAEYPAAKLESLSHPGIPERITRIKQYLGEKIKNIEVGDKP